MKLTSEQGRGGKIYIYCDGEYIMSLEPDTWYTLGYSEGEELTEQEFEEFKLSAGSRIAYAHALRFLTLRDHSSDELYKKLIKKHTPECAQYAVEKCRDLGFINDAEFAENFARELAERKHYGEMRIKNELYLKGISRDISDEVMSSLNIDYVANVTEVIEKKYYDCLSDEKGRKKMIAALTRLGYSFSEIKAAMSEYKIHGDDTFEY